METESQLKNIVEAALLAAGRPLSLEAIQGLFPEIECPDKPQLRSALQQLIEDYQGRGIEIAEVSSGWRIQVRETCSPWVSRLWEERPARYSRALMETLALIAYRQPITRGEVEDIRGVSVSTNIVKTLMEREWVRVLGHRDVPGRPALYGTTREFLDYFGLKSLDELPTLAELRDLDEINRELDLSDPDRPADPAGRSADAGEGPSVAAGISGAGQAVPADGDVGHSPTYADGEPVNEPQGADPAAQADAGAEVDKDAAAAAAEASPGVGQAVPAEGDVGHSPTDADGEPGNEAQRATESGSETPADMAPGQR
jgi:segregation and condensation protein B